MSRRLINKKMGRKCFLVTIDADVPKGIAGLRGTWMLERRRNRIGRWIAGVSAAAVIGVLLPDVADAIDSKNVCERLLVRLVDRAKLALMLRQARKVYDPRRIDDRYNETVATLESLRIPEELEGRGAQNDAARIEIMRGIAYHGMGNREKALDAFERGLSYGRATAETKSYLHYWVGRLVQENGLFDEAVEHLAAASANANGHEKWISDTKMRLGVSGLWKSILDDGPNRADEERVYMKAIADADDSYREIVDLHVVHIRESAAAMSESGGEAWAVLAMKRLVDFIEKVASARPADADRLRADFYSYYLMAIRDDDEGVNWKMRLAQATELIRIRDLIDPSKHWVLYFYQAVAMVRGHRVLEARDALETAKNLVPPYIDPSRRADALKMIRGLEMVIDDLIERQRVLWN